MLAPLCVAIATLAQCRAQWYCSEQTDAELCQQTGEPIFADESMLTEKFVACTWTTEKGCVQTAQDAMPCPLDDDDEVLFHRPRS